MKNRSLRANGVSFGDKKDISDIEEYNSNATIIRDLTFKVGAGEIVLVVGDKASQFLRNLADINSAIRPENKLVFKNYEYLKFAKRCTGEIIYSDADDNHLKQLTVEETIDFAVNCNVDVAKEDKVLLRDTLLSAFKLSEARHILVADENSSRLSVGERRRLSIIEAFLGNASLYLWDNCTNGLDSMTAMDIIQGLKLMARVTKTVNLFGCNQANGILLGQVDKILVLMGDYQVFYGSYQDCIQFFKSLQFPKDQSLLDSEYFSAVIYGTIKSPFINTDSDFHRHWIHSPYYKKANDESQIRYSKKSIDRKDIKSLQPVSILNQIKYCVFRSWNTFRSDKIATGLQVATVFLRSLTLGALFLDLPNTAVGSQARERLIFYILLMCMFSGISTVPFIFDRRPVIMKQIQMRFYRPWIDCLANIMITLAANLVLVTLSLSVLYVMVDFQRNLWRFSIFILIALTSDCIIHLMFLTIANISPNLALANGIGGILLISASITGSLGIPVKQMNRWFKVISLINPIRYAGETFLANELFNVSLECAEMLVPGGSNYQNIAGLFKTCVWPGAEPQSSIINGAKYLNAHFSYSHENFWRNYSILQAFSVFFFIASLLSAEYIMPLFCTKYVPRICWPREKYEGCHPTRIKPSKEVIIDNDSQSTFCSDQFMEKAYAVLPSSSCGTREFAYGNELYHSIISWSNLSYQVNGKLLLQNISGYIGPGLTLVLGESSSGKSALLNVLARRETNGVTGNLMLAGRPIKDYPNYHNQVGYVPQVDTHPGSLKVIETLEFSANVRGERDKAHIEKILSMLNLSGERYVDELCLQEKRMLSIGVELASKPAVALFVDEPSMGMDSEAAVAMIERLNKLADEGQAVLCSISQPSKSIFHYFDNLIVLDKSGQCVYFGSTEGAISYFTKHSATQYDEKKHNPSDMILSIVRSKLKDRTWVDNWQCAKEYAAAEATRVELERRSFGAWTSDQIHPDSLLKWPTCFCATLKRQFTIIARDKSYLTARLLLSLITGLYLAGSLWNTGNSGSSLDTTIFSVFICLAMSLPLAQQIQTKAAIMTKAYVAREMKAHAVGWPTLMAAQFLAEIPLLFSCCVLLYFCIYCTMGTSVTPVVMDAFFVNCLVFGLYCLSIGLVTLFVGLKLYHSTALLSLVSSLLLSVCGILQPHLKVAPIWRAIYQISPLTYFADTFTSLLLHDKHISCSQEEIISVLRPDGQSCSEYLGTFIQEFGGKIVDHADQNMCAYCSSDEISNFLSLRHMSYNHTWRNIAICSAFVALNFGAMICRFHLPSASFRLPKISDRFPVVFRHK
ncbi:AaceriAFR326Wp [[Ashbya] aceris (nom. inval.)]|nr:AaceriAFR326Wp [[Ashbya] aceris (nom. inval.)]